MYLLNKLGELVCMALFWIPAFAGMTARWLILSFPRKSGNPGDLPPLIEMLHQNKLKFEITANK